MKTKLAVIMNVLLILGAIVYSLFVSPKMPNIVPTHWNAAGQVDKYGNKALTLWLMPGTMVMMLVLLVSLPKISPEQFSIEPFKPAFNSIMVIVNVMVGYLHFIIIQAALNPKFDIIKFMGIGIFLCFALLGNSLGKIRKNYFMGIRTPWTLSSASNWIATHRMAAWTITGANLIAFFAILIGVNWLVCFAISTLSFLIPVCYSYYHFKTKPQQ